MDHKILAPSHWAAKRLVTQLTSAGCTARHTQYGKHHVVLAIAPMGIVVRACERAEFRPGLAEGYNER